MSKRVLHAVVSAVVLAGLAVPTATVTASAAGAAEPVAPAARPAPRELPPSKRLQVKFKDGVGATARADALARVAGRGHAVAVERRIAGLNAAVLDTDDQRAVLRLLRHDSRVEYVEPVSRYRALETPSPELVEIGAAAVHAPEAPASPNLGAGTQIAIIDSPVAAVADLNGAGKVVNAGDFAGAPNQAGEGWSDLRCDSTACPHGTGVASVAAAEADGSGMVGVAPGATIRSYNVFRHFVYDPGTAYEWHETYADSGAIADALTAIASYGAANPSLVAVNMSLGGMFDSQLVADAIELVRTQAPQVTVVVAAGNDGKERPNFPAGDPHVLSVGATGNIPDHLSCTGTPAAQWTVAGFSNRGDVDVVAPGRCVDAWYPDTDEFSNEVVSGSRRVQKVDGTSFAAPMVAGVAAMLGAAGVTGDAARAAIIAAATGTPSVDAGAGKAHAKAALDLGTGAAPYTAMSVDRGNQVASTVGSRTVEVLRVDPTKATTPDAPLPTVTGGFGAVAQKTDAAAAVAGVDRETFTYTVPAATKTGQSFALTADGGSGGDDAITLPMRMLDPTNGFEGVPTASGETGTAQLEYGSRSAYIRSVKVASTAPRFDYTFTFGEAKLAPERPRPSSLFVWEPTSVNGVADAAMQPVWESHAAPDVRSGKDFWTGGGSNPDWCEYDGTGDVNDESNWRKCRPGRYLVGFVAHWSAATSSSTSKYALRVTYAGPTATVTSPTVASAASTTGPFTVSWGGTRASTWDVWYAVRQKVGSAWTTSAWKPWRTKTTNRYGVFGSGGSPETVTPGRTYLFRTVSWDGLGNPSLPAVRATSAPVDDRAASMRYSTGWSNVSATNRWLKTAKRSGATNASVTMTAEASGFVIVGDKCSTCGQFKVYVNGVYKATVDTYRSSAAVRQTLWSSGTLGGTASRTVKIVVVGTKGRRNVTVDGIAAIR